MTKNYNSYYKEEKDVIHNLFDKKNRAPRIGRKNVE
jgi:hypothetical protein